MKGMKINMKFYLEELQCDWETHTSQTYGRDQINLDLIAKIKQSIIDEESDLYMVYAMDNRDNWLSMYFRDGCVKIDIVFENPEHNYVFYNKKYEGMKDLDLLEFDQDLVPKVSVCDDMALAANIFEEWALHGKLYPTTWVDDIEGDAFEDYYEEDVSECYYRLYLTGFGENKSKTIVFLKKYFKDNDYEQTRKRTEKFPLLLCVAGEKDILLMEEKLKKIGVEYQKEKISDDTYMKIYYPNPEDTLWDKLDAYLYN